MNIVDAIRSGKPIRRKDPRFGPCFGKVITDFESVVFLYSGNIKIPIVVADIIADDWEIEPTDKENSPEIQKLKQENEKLKEQLSISKEVLSDWINFERDQLKRFGPYVSKLTQSLVDKGESALAKLAEMEE